MRIPSREIPQADEISRIDDIVQAVSHGSTTYQELASAIGLVERQGRYYRLAAELLGLIVNENNTAVLTNLGKQFAADSAPGRKALMANAVLGLRLMQRIVNYLEQFDAGISRGELQSFIENVTDPAGPTMVPRRVHTITRWLSDVGVAQVTKDHITLQKGSPYFDNPLNIASSAEPILPRRFDLKEYEDVASRASAAQKEILILRNSVATERADNVHRQLVNLVAARVRGAGAIPKMNALIDLGAEVIGPLLFEMKSLHPANARSQIRSGVSQLYEYRYLQQIPEATLVLVTETPPPPDLAWMTEYLESDREILHVWDGDGSFYATEATRERLAFLWP